MIGIAETGSGKTAAFLIPLLTYVASLPVLTEATIGDGPRTCPRRVGGAGEEGRDVEGKEERGMDSKQNHPQRAPLGVVLLCRVL